MRNIDQAFQTGYNARARRLGMDHLDYADIKGRTGAELPPDATEVERAATPDAIRDISEAGKRNAFRILFCLPGSADSIRGKGVKRFRSESEDFSQISEISRHGPNPRHNVTNDVGRWSMDLAYTSTPGGNAVRHAHIIAAWQLAQSSRHTLSAYTRNLAAYCAWLDRVGLDLLTVRRVHVDGYRHTLTGVPSTVAVKLSALSSFYRYALGEGAIERNPVATVVRPNVDADHSATQGLSRDQAKALLAVASSAGPRANALINLLMFTGVRISEALSARTSDYGHDAGHRTLSIRRKGGKTAKVAVPAPAVVALNAYLGTTGTELVQGHSMSQPLFTTSTGRPWHRSEAARTVQRLARRAGIDGQISPHSLRHTFATIALDSGTSLHALQDSMGHADPRTTRRYDRARNNLQKSAGYDVARALA